MFGDFSNAASDYVVWTLLNDFFLIIARSAVVGSSRKQGGDAEHLIHGSETRICRLSFEF